MPSVRFIGKATVGGGGFIGRVFVPADQAETDEEPRDDAQLGLMQTDSGVERSSRGEAVLL